MIGMIDTVQFTTTPPATPFLGSVLALNVLGGMTALCPVLSSSITMAQSPCFFRVVFSPFATDCESALSVSLVPLLIDDSGLFLVLYIVLASFFTYAFSIGGAVLPASLPLIRLGCVVVLATFFKNFFAVSRVIFPVSFRAPLSVFAFPPNTLFKGALSIVFIIFMTPDRATGTTLRAQPSSITAQLKIFSRGRMFLAAFGTAFQGGIHSILTHASLTEFGQSGGVSTAFPVANGRLPMSIIPDLRIFKSNVWSPAVYPQGWEYQGPA